MTHLFQRDWNRQELTRYLGHMDQIAGVRLAEAADGNERGSRLLQVWTGSGLTFNVLPDRAMDISACEYKGVPLAWRSPIGDAHPAFYEPSGIGWLRSFQGGMLVTCGLDTFGPPVREGLQEFGQHGRVSNLPAREVGYHAGWSGMTIGWRSAERSARPGFSVKTSFCAGASPLYLGPVRSAWKIP
jgi:hypothetical protein